MKCRPFTRGRRKCCHAGRVRVAIHWQPYECPSDITMNSAWGSQEATRATRKAANMFGKCSSRGTYRYY